MTAFLLLLAQAAANPPANPSTPPTCEGAEYAAFDFWVGEWDVYPTGGDKQVATSKIEKLYNGCALRENWMPLKGGDGGSLNGYDPRTKRWHQTWIGSTPGPVQFVGGPSDGKMILSGVWPGSGPKGEDGTTRMTYSRLEDGAVRQHGEFSADGRNGWQTTFDLTYRRKGGAK
jgi:hypothetical protein